MLLLAFYGGRCRYLFSQEDGISNWAFAGTFLKFLVTTQPESVQRTLGSKLGFPVFRQASASPLSSITIFYKEGSLVNKRERVICSGRTAG